MNKKRIIIIGIFLLLTNTSFIKFLNPKEKVILDDVKLVNNNSSKSGMFAIMINDGNGEYTQSNSNDFPTDGYSYNEEKSGCIDSKGLEVENVLTYTDNKFSVRTNKAVYCYVYFDKQAALVKKLKDQPNSGLSEGLVGGMYRYQGASVNNYLCLEGKCSNQSDEMYRIIGITPEGNIKIIKQTSYGAYAWNTKYQDSTCGENGCSEWPDSEIYKTLNTDFYNSLDSGIQEKIQKRDWLYGDMHYNFVGTLSADEVYQVETGVNETKYYGPTTSNTAEVTDQKWTKTVNANIGLIYLHDYYYQANQENCQKDKSSNYTYCQTQGWMHMKNNGGTDSGLEQYEWTMSRVGRNSDSSTDFYAWFVDSSGYVSTTGSISALAIRPVFYLKNNITLYGSGTVNDPFRLTEPTEQENTLRGKDTNSALSKTLVGGMYRYQGADTLKGNKVKNYICLEKVGEAGCSGAKSDGYDNNMYRIIGITPDGNIKVMKQTRYGSTYVWNSYYRYHECGTSGCPEWPNSTIFNTLNGQYYNSLNKEIQNKIEPQNWWYGDMDFDFVGTLTAYQVYQVETGQADTQYYGKTSANKELVTDQRWTKMNNKEKIGLIYLHDYYYQAKQESCQGNKNPNYTYCQTQGWMHMKNNGGATSGMEQYELIMTRMGRPYSSADDFRAWRIGPEGYVNDTNLNEAQAVRPVFYLMSNIEIKGEGTYNNPFYIAS